MRARGANEVVREAVDLLHSRVTLYENKALATRQSGSRLLYDAFRAAGVKRGPVTGPHGAAHYVDRE